MSLLWATELEKQNKMYVDGGCETRAITKPWFPDSKIPLLVFNIDWG